LSPTRRPRAWGGHRILKFDLLRQLLMPQGGKEQE